jgi:hypothetical protein
MNDSHQEQMFLSLFLHSVQAGYAAHPACYPMGYSSQQDYKDND